MWIRLSKENVQGKPMIVHKPDFIHSSKHRISSEKVLLLEKGPVTSMYSDADGEVTYSCKLRIMQADGSCRAVRIRYVL